MSEKPVTDRARRWYMSDTERFWDRVAIGTPDECWLWGGSIKPNGYGKVHFEGRFGQAHRTAYALAKGPIPDGLVIDHLCRVRACVNPSHLEAVTQRENLLRGDTLSGAYAARTECNAGHPYDEANTRRGKTGARMCRTCDRERARQARATKREAA